MKTIEELESEFQAWTPRSPSARLRAELFGQPTVERARVRHQTPLALASAAALALVLAFRQGAPEVPANVGASQAMLAAAVSNQDLIAYVCYPVNQEWNLPAAGFGCTNLRKASVWTSFPARCSTLR